MPSWYDDWKLACCGRWPHCSPCPFDEEPDDEEEQEDEDYAEDEES